MAKALAAGQQLGQVVVDVDLGLSGGEEDQGYGDAWG